MDLQFSQQTRETSGFDVFWAFARIGATSFGGGSATVAAMRKLCFRRGWLDERGFVNVLVLSKLTPGISILAQALLIGRAACGVSGMIASLAGLLAPSITITVLLAWLYEEISQIPNTAGPLHAISGVAAGFAVALAIQFLRDILLRSRRVLNAVLFVAYMGAAYLIANPLISMAAAVVVAILIPGLFDAPNQTDDDADAETPEVEHGS